MVVKLTSFYGLVTMTLSRKDKRPSCYYTKNDKDSAKNEKNKKKKVLEYVGRTQRGNV